LFQAKQLIIANVRSTINFKNKELRLSCELDVRDKFNDISPTENRILNICERIDLRPQVVYPYPHPIDWPKKVMEILFKAHTQVMNNSPQKETPVLIMPRDLDIEQLKGLAKDCNINIIIADIRNNEDIPQAIDKNTIVIMRTGPIDPRVFDNLLARRDFFPAVIEGCNSIETCEYEGVPYINADRHSKHLRKFDDLNKTHQKQQDMQYQASRCLELGANDNEYFSALTQYLQESRNHDFQDYHSARQIAYKENLSDSVENAFSLLAIFELAEPLKPLAKSNIRPQ
jgi:hypothetical protein